LAKHRQGAVLMKLAPGEKLRIWWDSRGASDPTEEHRVQVGPAVTLPQAEALIRKLKAQDGQPDRVRVVDGDTGIVFGGPRAFDVESWRI
jgi:stage II sporulation protein D